MIKKAVDATLEEFQTEILAFGVTLFTFIFLWEVTTSRETLNLWIVLPIAVGAFLSDRSFELPFFLGRLHHYQWVIVAALSFFTPVNSTLVTLFLLASLLTRTYFRFRTQMAQRQSLRRRELAWSQHPGDSVPPTICLCGLLSAVYPL